MSTITKAQIINDILRLQNDIGYQHYSQQAMQLMRKSDLINFRRRLLLMSARRIKNQDGTGKKRKSNKKK